MQTLWTHYYDGRRYVLSYGEWSLANLQDMWLQVSGTVSGTRWESNWRKDMKIEFIEKIKELGIGAYIIAVAVFFILLMLGWLIYNIFISSKG